MVSQFLLFPSFPGKEAAYEWLKRRIIFYFFNSHEFLIILIGRKNDS